jgi:hypothetical protein
MTINPYRAQVPIVHRLRIVHRHHHRHPMSGKGQVPLLCWHCWLLLLA